MTNALENMKSKGLQFQTGKVNEWLDCGNKDITVSTHQSVLKLNPKLHTVAATATIENSTIIPPCHIDENTCIKNSVIGPYVSVGVETTLEDCVIQNSIIQNNSIVKKAIIRDSMIGNNAHYSGRYKDLSIGDYTSIKE